MTAAVASSASPRPQAGVTIRPFAEADYPVVIALENAVWPDYPQTEAEWRFKDENRHSKAFQERFVAEEAETGRVLGFGSCFQWIEMWHPRKYHIRISVLPESQRRGIGKRLYDHLRETLTPYDPILIRARTRADQTRAVAFLERSGFVEEMRELESRLNMAAFDPAAFAGAESRVAEQGITIRTLAELRTSDPDFAHKLFDLDWTIIPDMPAPDVLTRPTFEHWKKTILGSPNLLPEAWFVALDGDRYVGESTLWRHQGGGELEVGATGVLREYRRRGIALALKLRACAFARAYGCPEIRTWNAESNRAMLSINEALGFVKQPAWISYVNVLKEETERREGK